MPERLDKHKERSHWRERLADFGESIEKRDPRRFEFVMMACLVVGLTVLLCSAYMPTLHGFAEGEPAPRSVEAGKTVYVVNIAETDKARAQVAKTVAKVYVSVTDAQTTAASELDAFLVEIIQLRESGATVAQAGVSAVTLDYLLKTDSDSFDRLRSSGGAGADEAVPRHAHNRRRLHQRGSAKPSFWHRRLGRSHGLVSRAGRCAL